MSDLIYTQADYDQIMLDVRLSTPDDLRAHGWMVAVHNDYRLNGERLTFWLLTKGDECVQGEAYGDRAALEQIRNKLRDRGHAWLGKARR